MALSIIPGRRDTEQRKNIGAGQREVCSMLVLGSAWAEAHAIYGEKGIWGA